MRRMISTRQGMMASRASADDKNNNNTHLFYVLSVDKLKRFLLSLRYFYLKENFVVAVVVYWGLNVEIFPIKSQLKPTNFCVF